LRIITKGFFPPNRSVFNLILGNQSAQPGDNSFLKSWQSDLDIKGKAGAKPSHVRSETTQISNKRFGQLL
jgi:hypothetical protein